MLEELVDDGDRASKETMIKGFGANIYSGKWHYNHALRYVLILLVCLAGADTVSLRLVTTLTLTAC